jgi:VWFA-related protein
LALPAFAVSAATLVAGHAQQRPKFVSGVDTVSASVTVHQGNLPVTGLKADDFAITDNGVPQTADYVSDDSLPIDLTLVLDTSGSVEPMMDQLRADIAETSAMMHDDDRVRLITFTDTVVESSPFLPARELSFDRLAPDGLTSIYHAAAAAMMRTRSPDRHELVVLFTDGFDTSSTLGGATLLDIARRSDAVMDIFIVTLAPGLPSLTGAADHSNDTRGRWVPFKPEIADATRNWLDQSAATTGGQLEEIFGEAHVPGGLKTRIDDMHTSYIVYFTPKNVAKPGWHDLKFKLKRPGDFSIRARKGYLGPAK